MTAAETAPAPHAATGAGDLEALFGRQRAAVRAVGAPGYDARLAVLERLQQAVLAHSEAVADAIAGDFGHRSRHETAIAEVYLTVGAIRHARARLGRWMRPRRRPVALTFLPGRARVLYEPLGVVGIISPWNYPFNLAMAPLTAALAAGNRVMLKPSEYTPRTSELLAGLVAETFEPDEVAVVTGGPEVGAAFAGLPFDHLMYTGSGRVAAEILRAAAANLTPVTLELGGKSPAIVAPDYPIDQAALKIMAGKLFNAGQTCIAPDYALVPEGRLEAFEAAAQSAVARLYPSLAENPDYSAIITERHYARLAALVEEARARGARVVAVGPAAETLDPARHKFPPTLVIGAAAESGLMTDEIFGPVLPLVPYRELGQAIDHVNARPKPLALYYFDRDRARIERVLAETSAGGVTVNDVLLHYAQNDLPFGGVGASGMGAYHGFDGFETFSHKKAVFLQSRINGARLLLPPFGRLTERLLALLIGR